MLGRTYATDPMDYHDLTSTATDPMNDQDLTSTDGGRQEQVSAAASRAVWEAAWRAA